MVKNVYRCPCRRGLFRLCFVWALLLPLLCADPVMAHAERAVSKDGASQVGGGKMPSDADDAAMRPVEVRELWTGSLYTSTYRVGVCYTSTGALRGVVHLKLRSGEVDVYHIIGEVRNNEVRAHHSSGHSFTGRLISENGVEGIIILKNGMRVRLEGVREHNAHLADDDCAPLP